MEAGVVVPELDVADSVRRMLEAARPEQGEGAAEGRIPAAPAVMPAPVLPAAPLPAEATPPVTPSAVTLPVRTAAPSPPPSTRTSDYVPLPEREFTVRGVDDIRELARELEEAKQRQRRQE